jgi:AraC-like DNA-binding protein
MALMSMFLALLFAFAAFQAIFIAISAELKTNAQSLAVRWFSLLMALVAFKLAHDTAVWSHFILNVPWLLYTGSLPVFLLGPLVFLLVRQLLEPDLRFKLADLLHFIPFAIYLVWRFPKLMESQAHKLKTLESFYASLAQDPQLNESWVDVLRQYILWHSHMQIYLLVTLVMLWRWRRSALHPKLAIAIWLPLIALLVLRFGETILLLFGGLRPQLQLIFFPINGLIQTLVIFLLAYRGFGNLVLPIRPQPVIATPCAAIEPEAPIQGEIPAVSSEVQVVNHPDEDVDRSALDRLTQLMAEQKPYRDPGLTLSDLADLMQMTERTLSRLLNSGMQKNFYEYLNSFRVEEIKQLLLDENKQHLTIDGLASEAGFSSKTVFYRTFKTETGQTPSAFRKAQRGKSR